MSPKMGLQTLFPWKYTIAIPAFNSANRRGAFEYKVI